MPDPTRSPGSRSPQGLLLLQMPTGRRPRPFSPPVRMEIPDPSRIPAGSQPDPSRIPAGSQPDRAWIRSCYLSDLPKIPTLGPSAEIPHGPRSDPNVQIPLRSRFDPLSHSAHRFCRCGSRFLTTSTSRLWSVWSLNSALCARVLPKGKGIWGLICSII